MDISAEELVERGLKASEAEALMARVGEVDASSPPTELWQRVSRLLKPEYPFAVHEYVHAAVFADWDPRAGPAPGWVPGDTGSTNIAWLMRTAGKESYAELYQWSISQRVDFWTARIERLDVRFAEPPSSVLDTADGVEQPGWLVGARLNVVDSCFNAPDDSPAVVYQREGGPLESMTVAELRALVFRVANGLAALGVGADDMIAIDMPMTVEAVAIFLGAVAAGVVVVTVADSFAPDEIRVRLDIATTKLIFTQDFNPRAGKKLPLYEKVVAAGAPQAVVLPAGESVQAELRDGDITWEEFLCDDPEFSTAAQPASAHTCILFSSGTTGEPKAIPWDNTAPLKSAIDGHLHHDIRPGDVVCWPTNLGWMMGPWLVYAALMNRATMALYYGPGTGREFCQFVADAGVTMLGLVPSLVVAWKANGCIDGLDWTGIRAFSSTGECSNPADMLFLMSRAGYRPVIEYCGGTEIGGGYITGTVVQPSAPGTFSTPALGCELVILDEEGRPADVGEVFLVPPAMGLSRELLNRDHHEVYYAGTPAGPDGELLRRHGDRMQRLAGGYFRAHGRVDDSMNLGGIKVSSVQIEEVINDVAGVSETAAIAVSPPGGGPSRLVIYAVLTGGAQAEPGDLMKQMQQQIRTRLNPLFKVQDVVIVGALPRTASNKVMRRKLRAAYEERMSR